MTPKERELAIHGKLLEAKAITGLATKESRGLEPAERVKVAGLLADVERLKSDSVGMSVSASGNPYTLLAKSIMASGHADIAVKDLVYGPDSEQVATRVPGILPELVDSRFIYPLFEQASLGSELAVTDYRQVSRSVADASGSGDDGDIERDPRGDAVKAELSVDVEAVTAPVRQLACMVRGIPNAVLASEGSLAGLLSSQLQLALAQGLDAHVMRAITEAGPASGGTGSTIEELVRTAMNDMAAKGRQANVLVLSPGDAATVDQHTFVDAITAYPYGLTVKISPDIQDGSPLLIDTSRAGVVYTGALQLASDPYTGFERNLTSLRGEYTCLAIIRDVDALMFANGSGS